MPPAALVRITAFTPMLAKTRMGKTTSFAEFPNNKLSRMANSCRLGKVRNFRVGNLGGAGKFVGKSAKSRTKNQSDLGPQNCLSKNEIGSFACTLVLTESRSGFRHGGD